MNELKHGDGVIYKGIKARIINMPWSLNNNYVIIPERSIDNIGNGAGMSLTLPPEKIECLKRYSVKQYEV
jgi:hypothetical protein